MPPAASLLTALWALAAGGAAWTPDAGLPREALHERMTPAERAFFFGAGEVPPYDVVALPSPSRALLEGGGGGELPFAFRAFGRLVPLRLRRNGRLIAGSFVGVARGAGGSLWPLPPPPPCHFLHSDAFALAALSLCGGVSGFVRTSNDTFEVRPLTARLRALLLRQRRGEGEGEGDGGDGSDLHIVRRGAAPRQPFAPDDQLPLPSSVGQAGEDVEALFGGVQARSRRRRRGATAYTVELALFFDAAAYALFSPFFGGDEGQMRDMLLAYVNGVQALYRHPTLGARVDLTLVRLELQRTQPPDLPTHGGERGALLDSFCAFSAKHNVADDADPRHWDMGLYVSGLDFYAVEGGRKSGVTMGLATVGGVCLPPYDCVIAELGTTNAFGKPYPSAGFTSVYVLAHEIGHNLGMHHDGGGNSCPKEGFIMSPSRGTNGETVWSTCSAQVMAKLDQFKCLRDVPKAPPPKERDHARFLEQPGQAWGAKRQCEFLLRDRDAAPLNPDNLQDICQNLKCRTPHRTGFYFAGPALEGTTCAKGKLCLGGQCVAGAARRPGKEVAGGWGPWKEEKCASGCLEGSKGFASRRRACDSPPPANSARGCDGVPVDVALCDDAKLCGKKRRRTAAEYAGAACAQFAKLLPDLDPAGGGLQAPHEDARPWVACAVFCKRKDTGLFYTPRLDLNDMGVDAHFPDGTLCNGQGQDAFFCLQHHCVPEALVGRGLGPVPRAGEPAVPQNAPPQPGLLSDELRRYLSLGADGKPLLTTLSPASSQPPPDEEWAARDYLELPPSAAGDEADFGQGPLHNALQTLDEVSASSDAILAVVSEV